jgi:uncharacterized protein
VCGVNDLLRYDRMVETALRGVVREALARAASSGLPGAHHFYITFRTGFPGIDLPESLTKQFPEDMTIVLEHQFWDLEVEETKFSVTLSFNGKPERLVVPFGAITGFADPSVKFALQFQAETMELPFAPAEAERPEPAAPPRPTQGEVVALDAFRKK